MAVDAQTLQGMLQAYIGLNNRFVFSSVLRERNKINLSRASGNINTLKAKSPYLPFVLLINPKSYTFEGWKQSYSIAQMVDGLSVTLQPNCEFQTLRISGSSGDLQLIYDNVNTVGLNLFNSSLPEGFENIFAGNHAIDMQALDGESTTQLLSQFYNVMSVFTNTKNAKIQVMHLLKSWSDEPNVIVDGGSQYYNLKRITIFSAIYPLGKTYHGIIENPFTYTNTAETYREINYDIGFKIIKEAKLDLVNEGVPQKAPANSSLNTTKPEIKKNPVQPSFRKLSSCPGVSQGSTDPNDPGFRLVSKSVQIFETFMGIKDWTQDPDNLLGASSSGGSYGFIDTGANLQDVLKKIGTINDLESETPQPERFLTDIPASKLAADPPVYDGEIIKKTFIFDFFNRIAICPEDFSDKWKGLEARLKKVFQTTESVSTTGGAFNVIKIYGVKIPISRDDYLAAQDYVSTHPNSGIFVANGHAPQPNPSTLIFSSAPFTFSPIAEANLPIVKYFINQKGTYDPYPQHIAGSGPAASSDPSSKVERPPSAFIPRAHP